METAAIKGNQLGILNLVVFVLSVYVLMAIFIDTVFVLPTETSVLLNYIDNTICVFFFLEFCVRSFQAGHKLRFMRWGWVDLISSIPAVSYLRAGRVLRLIGLSGRRKVSSIMFLKTKRRERSPLRRYWRYC
jgi:voltage-gated potassium channel